MQENDYRPMVESETLILQKLLSVNTSGIRALRDQARHATARALDKFGSIGFKIDNSTSSQFRDGPLISARQRDRDTGDEFGPHINILLFIRNGFLDELQIYKDDASVVIDPIDPAKFNDIIIDARRCPQRPEIGGV